MKRYKVWMIIEEIDEEDSYYEEVPDEIRSVGPEFNTLFEAAQLRDRILDYVTTEKE